MTGHVRLAVPFVLGKVYDLVETVPETPGIPTGLALRDNSTAAHYGWVKTSSRDHSNSLGRVRDALRAAGRDSHVARIKVTRVGNLFESVDRSGVSQVGVHGDAFCWIDLAGSPNTIGSDTVDSDADSEGR
jgi:hypothetical protein